MRQCIGSMLDVHQAVGRDIQQTTYLIHGYFRNDADERRLIHARYMAQLRARLEGLRNALNTLQGVINLDVDDGRQFPWEIRIEQKLRHGFWGQPLAERAMLEVAQTEIAQAAADIRHLVVGFVSICDTLDQLIGMLHDAYIVDNPLNVNGYLEAVIAAKASKSITQMIEVAARREIATITNVDLLSLIKAWYDCIFAYQRESHLHGFSPEQLRARRAQAHDAYLQRLARMHANRRVQVGEIDESQRARVEADYLESMRNSVGNDHQLRHQREVAGEGHRPEVSERPRL